MDHPSSFNKSGGDLASFGLVCRLVLAVGALRIDFGFHALAHTPLLLRGLAQRLAMYALLPSAVRIQGRVCAGPPAEQSTDTCAEFHRGLPVLILRRLCETAAAFTIAFRQRKVLIYDYEVQTMQGRRRPGARRSGQRGSAGAADRGERDRVRGADIRRLAPGEGWLYLAALLAACSCRVVGWATAMRFAFLVRWRCRPTTGVVHRSCAPCSGACHCAAHPALIGWPAA